MIEVRVSDTSGASVPRAEVVVQRNAQAWVAAPTDVPGTYRTPALPSGTYLVTVFKRGFAAISREVRLGPTPLAIEIALQPQSLSESVRVEGAAPYAAPVVISGTRLPADPLDVPQSVDVVTRALLQSQAALSMSDALQNVTGVTPHLGEGRRDQVSIRGFSAINDTYIDGVRDDAKYYRDVSNLEQIEVVKGPAAALFGRGSSGGVVNRVTKKPIFGTPIADVSVILGSYDRKRVAADAGRSFADRRLALRVTGAFEQSGSHRPYYSLDRSALAPSLAWRPRDGAELLVQAEFLADDRLPDRGIPSYQGRPVDAARAYYYGYPEDDFLRNRVASPAVTWQQTAGAWTLRSITRLAWYINDFSNTYASGVRASRDGLVVARGQYDVSSSQRNLFTQADASRTLRTGAIDHTLLVGVELGAQRTMTDRGTGVVGDVLLLDPVLTAPVYASTAQIQNTFNGRVAAAFVQDQIAFGARWRALVGARLDDYQQRLDDRTSAQADFGRSDVVVSPRAGVVFRATRASSLYGSVSRSFQPSGDGLSLAANTADLEPELTTAYETGVKADVGRMTLTGALFRLDRTNVKTSDPLNPGLLVLVGRQRSDGVEVSASGAIRHGWDVRGGVTFLDPTILRSNDISSGVRVEGNRIGNVTRRTASIWSTYQLPGNLSLGGGAFFVDNWFTSNDNLVRVDGHTRVDAIVAYRFARYEIALNVRNLLDAGYYESSQSNTQIMPASGRNGLVTLRYRW
jgi:catecholate siderophore receptor